ncbi:K domain type 1 [Trinorchestia longiramus]|nr:K domain type 1 [Trinorchestia longiramus]
MFLFQLCGGQVKAFSSCCPQSTDRVIQIAGDRSRVLLTLSSVVDTLKDTPIKGVENPYNPYNYEDFYAGEYGGWGEGKGRFPRGGGPMPPMGGPQGPMSGRGPMGPPGGPMGPRDGGMGPFGDRRRGGGPPGGPFSPPRNGNAMNRRGGDDFDMMPSNGVGGKGGYWNNNQPMGMAEQVTTQVTIPKDVAGAIIGKGGARIRKIRADSCCSINIEDARPGSNDRVITIVGEEQQIKYAQYLLQQSVREFGGPVGRRDNY